VPPASTIAETDDGENTENVQAYTAFGERVGAGAVNSRYRYGGGWGYESGLLVLEGAAATEPIEFLHLGERWYQPNVGRFVQRDPIGIAGGLNVYVYVNNNPVLLIDPSGMIMETLKKAARKVAGALVGGGTGASGGLIVGVAIVATAVAAGVTVAAAPVVLTAGAAGFVVGAILGFNRADDPTRALAAGLGAGIGVCLFMVFPGPMQVIGINSFYIEDHIKNTYETPDEFHDFLDGLFAPTPRSLKIIL